MIIIPQFQPGGIDAGSAVSSAWEMVKLKYGMYLGVSLITLVLTGCIPCLNLFLIGPILGGIAFLVLRDQRGEPVEFGMMFKGFEKFVPLMVIGLLQAIPGIIMQIIQYGVRFAEIGLNGGRNGRPYDFYMASDATPLIAGGMLIVVVIVSLVLVVFSLVWWMCFFFAIPLAMEHDLGPMDAIKLSAKAAMGNIGGLIVTLIFSILVMLLGMVMLCIGMFLVSMPIIYVMNVLVYRMVFPDARGPVNMAPPPPSAYGSYGNQFA